MKESIDSLAAALYRNAGSSPAAKQDRLAFTGSSRERRNPK
jgi:hypothetical protein